MLLPLLERDRIEYTHPVLSIKRMRHRFFAVAALIFLVLSMTYTRLNSMDNSTSAPLGPTPKAGEHAFFRRTRRKKTRLSA